MKLTKYEHACFTVEIEGKTLIVDPGVFTKSLEIPSNVVAIVITHEHPDHFDPDMLATIYDKNPNSILVSLASITEKMPNHNSRSVEPGDKVGIEPFELEFFGGKHAQVHSSIPIADNVGVFINDKVYFPGDSFVEPHRPVELLALPASGPWLKFAEVIDFLLAVKPKKFFTTHDVHSSDAGKDLLGNMIAPSVKQISSEYIRLVSGQSLEI